MKWEVDEFLIFSITDVALQTNIIVIMRVRVRVRKELNLPEVFTFIVMFCIS